MKYQTGDLVSIFKNNKRILGVVLEHFFDTVIYQAVIEDSITKKVYITNKDYVQQSLVNPYYIDNLNKDSNLYKTIKLKVNLLKLGES